MFLNLMFASALWSGAGEDPALVKAPPIPVPAALPEPDGSRQAGLIPRFTALPAPPPELRALSHKQAMVDTEHYLYEAYAADPEEAKGGPWLVRYVLLPEVNESFREIEQIFLFAPNLAKKPRALRLDEVQVENGLIRWKGKTFRLVDRRDLTTRA